MSFRLNPFALAATLLMSGAIAPALAQQAAPAPQPAASAVPPAADVQGVEIKGIRASYASSLSNKKGADSVVEVVTAEDIGKLPAKNVADTVQRLPGVNISSNSGGDGAFADANRVSIRGTAPSLTQTLVNGHSVGSADWFIANQGVNGGASGRSVSYDLLPAEIVGEGHRLQDLAGRPDRGRRHRLGRHRDALAAEPDQAVDAGRLDLRPPTARPRARPTRRSAAWSAGRTTPGPSA